MTKSHLKAVLLVPSLVAAAALFVSPAAPSRSSVVEAQSTGEWKDFAYDQKTGQGFCFDTGNKCHVAAEEM